MKILAIDYGLKRIGLAISEDSFAQPLKVIDQSEKTVAEIIRICQQEEVTKIVVGLPQGKLVPKIKQFAHQLATKTKIPLVFQDETLTSQEAAARMIEAGKKQKSRRENQDAAAAAIILQDYLDAHV